MKKLLFILSMSLSYNFCTAQIQSLPYISSPTIIPQSPTSSDIIKIVTKVTTPNQGIIVYPGTFSVTQNPKEINISGCYWQGMLTATQEFVDTFTIGQLPIGSYTIKHKAYLSSGQQICHRIDSNMVILNLTVASNTQVTTGLGNTQKDNSILVFPNPVKNILYFKNNPGNLTVEIYSYEGRIIKTEELGLSSEIAVGDLADGLYFINLSGKNRSETIKFVKFN